MNAERQEIAIAEFCGWTDIRKPCDDSYHLLDNETLGWLMGRVAGVKPGERVHKIIPDYTSDLNAMHEAERKLIGEQRNEYWTNLFQIADVLKSEPAWWLTLHATAAQRAEAFLRTIGKCEEKQ